VSVQTFSEYVLVHRLADAAGGRRRLSEDDLRRLYAFLMRLVAELEAAKAQPVRGSRECG
jgi:hypothetical protein